MFRICLIWIFDSRNSIRIFCKFWILNFLHAFSSKHRKFLKWTIFFVCFATKVYRFVYLYAVFICCIRETWRIVVIAIFAFWYNLKNHCDRDFHIDYFIIHFDFYQFALKIWKLFSWMIQKKHDLMIQMFAVFSIENLTSYNSRFSIW